MKRPAVGAFRAVPCRRTSREVREKRGLATTYAFGVACRRRTFRHVRRLARTRFGRAIMRCWKTSRGWPRGRDDARARTGARRRRLEDNWSRMMQLGRSRSSRTLPPHRRVSRLVVEAADAPIAASSSPAGCGPRPCRAVRGGSEIPPVLVLTGAGIPKDDQTVIRRRERNDSRGSDGSQEAWARPSCRR